MLVHPAGISAAELGRHIGDLVLAGLAGEDIELRSDVEVLAAVTGNRVLLVDADRDRIAGHPDRTVAFDPDRLAAIVAEDPFATTVALTGDPSVRDRFMSPSAAMPRCWWNDRLWRHSCWTIPRPLH